MAADEVGHLPDCFWAGAAALCVSAMQLALRFLFSALIAVAAALFTALIAGSILPRFEHCLELLYAIIGAVFTLAGGYTAPGRHRRLIAIVLIGVGTAALIFLDFRSEPLSFLAGAFLAYAFPWFTRRP